MSREPSGQPVHIIAYGVLAADLSHLTKQLGFPCSMEFLPGGLHTRPQELQTRLQERIDDLSASFRGERIVLGYGVCGLGTVGLHARNVPLVMAREFGWKYEELTGTHSLLTELLTATHSTEQVLCVPPHHVTAHDPVHHVLQAVPVWKTDSTAGLDDCTLICDGPADGGDTHTPRVRTGLGIDAGGTYTDVVLYDFEQDKVVAKAKSHTTRWDFTVGIGRALDKLAAAHSLDVELVSISTTLATNAIVENRGQKVGLLIFPPYGLFKPSDIAYRPLGILQGELEVDGRERKPVDIDLVRAEARRMVDKQRVGAFAVSGYASDVNPSHEQQVKQILQAETGLSITCAHEVSQQGNYRVRSVTAALNASIIPVLEAFLNDVDKVLRARGITAPRMVVRSDGALMSLPVARRRPIETILSGPAASVAGAAYLAKQQNATVVDMGGTTTDTATIRNGAVRICEKGVSVGGWATHVRALDLQTVGLGGDSLIAWHGEGPPTIGPARVAPVAWALKEGRGSPTALDWLEENLDRFRGSTEGMTLVLATGAKPFAELPSEEQRVLDALAGGACSIEELAIRLKAHHWTFLPLDALERKNLIIRSALTPTDLLHATGQLDLWSQTAARHVARLFCRLMRRNVEEFARYVHQEMVRRLALELLRKHLAENGSDADFDRSETASALLENWLRQGGNAYRVRIVLDHPVVGIGAPIHAYLPDAAKLFETRPIIPEHADVANAIGAITSRVVVQKTVEISPSDTGGYRIAGLQGTPQFSDFVAAHEHAVAALQTLVRQEAEEAGTSDTRVEILVHDRVAPTARGSQIFIGRVLTARLTGRPDIARLASP